MSAPTAPPDTPPRPAPGGGRAVYRVSELTALLRDLIEGALPRTWVEGEISNLSQPASGHWYFTLKDAQSQIRCAMFRNANRLVRPPPKNGDQVLVRGQVSLYEARGDLQLICEHMEPAGEGALLREFEALKRRLAAEGLFDEADKRLIPPRPRAIGVITSATGAAVHDILTTLANRYPLAPVTLYPVPVQGAEAAPAIARALAELPQRAAVDVIILARGGGSLEDLWAFNEEAVARAIRACAVPVVCGVGHETDVTIADFAADLRAPTPTGAAERITPDIRQWRQAVDAQLPRLRHALERRLARAAESTANLTRRLQSQHPGRRLQDRAQRLDELLGRAGRSQAGLLQRRRQQLDHARTRLRAATPAARLLQADNRLHDRLGRLQRAIESRLRDSVSRIDRCDALLAGLSPHAVLERGYAIALDRDGRALGDTATVAAGDALRVILARGSLDATVDRTHPPTSNDID